MFSFISITLTILLLQIPIHISSISITMIPFYYWIRSKKFFTNDLIPLTYKKNVIYLLFIKLSTPLKYENFYIKRSIYYYRYTYTYNSTLDNNTLFLKYISHTVYLSVSLYTAIIYLSPFFFSFFFCALEDEKIKIK